VVIISIHIHSPLEAARRRASRSVLAEFVLRRRTHCYFQASDRNSVIAIIFIDHDFLLDSNDLVIERNFQLICHSTDKNLLYFYLMISNMCHMLRFALGWRSSSLNSVKLSVYDLQRFCCWYVTSRCDLDLWPLDLERL